MTGLVPCPQCGETWIEPDLTACRECGGRLRANPRRLDRLVEQSRLGSGSEISAEMNRDARSAGEQADDRP